MGKIFTLAQEETKTQLVVLNNFKVLFDSLHEAKLDWINIEHLAGSSVTEQNFVLKHVKSLHNGCLKRYHNLN